VFDALDTLDLSVSAMTGMVGDMEPVPERMRAAAGEGFSTATDLADWLVRALDLPFREAHHVTGRIVALAADRGQRLDQLPLTDLQGVEPRITDEARAALSVENAVASRTSLGGTAPAEVARRAGEWIARLESEAGPR
jgi:argininosuccinate lyase